MFLSNNMALEGGVKNKYFNGETGKNKYLKIRVT